AHDLGRPRRIDAHDGVSVAGEILSEFTVFRDRRAESGHQHDNRRALSLERVARDRVRAHGVVVLEEDARRAVDLVRRVRPRLRQVWRGLTRAARSGRVPDPYRELARLT